MHISVVSPVYKAPKILPELVARLERSLSEITDSFEVILVDDGCPWDSWSVVEELAQKYTFVRGIKLSRNFGQHHAITAGLDHVKGEWVVVMDCDLQDKPEEILSLYIEAQNGYDIVYASRENRRDSILKRFFSNLFSRIFTYLTDIQRDGTIANFGLYHKKVILEHNKLREPTRGFAHMIFWLGFRSSTVIVSHGQRFEGKSSYNIKKSIGLAANIILAYSDKPLKLTIKLGFFISFVSLLFAVYNLFLYAHGHIKQPGFISLIFSIWFLSGLVILILGVIGLYLGKTFEGVKNRSLYIIDHKLNLN